MMYDVTKKSIAQLTTPEIIESLMLKDDEKSQARYDRFRALIKAVKSQNDSRYIIAYQLAKIDECQDFKEYGYKTISEMSEKLFGYKKNTTSQLISTANAYLVNNHGQIESVFKNNITLSEDEYVASLEMADIPITVLFEMMYSNSIMTHHRSEIIDFYSCLLTKLSGVPSQKDMRDVKAVVKEVFACSKPLTYDTYEAKLLEMKEEKDNKKDSNKDEKKDSNKEGNKENSETPETKVSTVKKIQATLMNLQAYFEILNNELDSDSVEYGVYENLFSELKETYEQIMAEHKA